MGQVQDLGHLQVGQAQLGVHHLREMGRAIGHHRQVADRCVQPPLGEFAPEELAEAGIGLGAGHIGHAHLCWPLGSSGLSCTLVMQALRSHRMTQLPLPS